MCGCLLGKFSKRVRSIDSFEDADLKVVLKIVLIRVGANIELIGDTLAVDCVEQRVKFIRSCQYLICHQAKPDGPDLNTRNGTDLDKEGFDVVAIAGLEGVASNFDHEVEEANENQQEHLAEVVQETREDEAVADLSNHILAVCRVEKQTE